MNINTFARCIALASGLFVATHAGSAFAVTVCEDDFDGRFLDEVCRDFPRTEVAEALVVTDLISIDFVAGDQVAILELLNDDGDVVCEVIDEGLADGPINDICFRSGSATSWRITVT